VNLDLTSGNVVVAYAHLFILRHHSICCSGWPSNRGGGGRTPMPTVTVSSSSLRPLRDHQPWPFTSGCNSFSCVSCGLVLVSCSSPFIDPPHFSGPPPLLDPPEPPHQTKTYRPPPPSLVTQDLRHKRFHLIPRRIPRPPPNQLNSNVRIRHMGHAPHKPLGGGAIGALEAYPVRDVRRKSHHRVLAQPGNPSVPSSYYVSPPRSGHARTTWEA